MADVARLEANARVGEVRPQALDAKGTGALEAPAQKDADLDFRLKPGQTATIRLDDGKGGPEQPPAEVGIKDLVPILDQLVKVMTAMVQLFAKLLGGAEGKGGPATTPLPLGQLPNEAGAQAQKNTLPPKGSKADKLQALEQQFGAWRGKGKNSKAPTGPKASKLFDEAYSKLAGGDAAGAQESYSKAQKTGSPVMLDLDGDGKLGTTGASTAKERMDGQTGRMVQFDLDGDGVKDTIEWSDGSGDGFLVDDSDGGATGAMNGNGQIDGRRLFGDEGGKYASGYDKLRRFDANGDGVLEGAELAGLKMWVDDGDASVGRGELRSLADLGITRISVGMNLVKNGRGEDLMRSTFTQDGRERASEDVWFAKG